MKTAAALAIALALAIAPFSALKAEDVKVYSKAPSPQELGADLFGWKTRAVKMKGGRLDVGSQKQPDAVAMRIKFAYDSVEILDESRPYLDSLGKMMAAAQNQGGAIILEGHTDASGSETYNRALSQRRAEAVKQRLVRDYGVAGHLLFVQGMGEQAPLDGVAPTHPDNRRVQIRRAQ